MATGGDDLLGLSMRNIGLIGLFLFAEAVVLVALHRPIDGWGQRLTGNSIYQHIRIILFCLALSLCSIRSLMYVGFTARTDAGYALFGGIEMYLNHYVKILLFILLFIEILEHPLRGALAFVFFMLYDAYAPTYNRIPVLVELALLAVLSNLSNRKWTGYAWLISHLLYIMALPVLLHLGYVEEVTRPRTFLGMVLQGSSFGMGHPNSLGVLMVTMTFLVWYLFKPKKWLVTILIFGGAAILTWVLTFSRTATLILMALPAVYIVVRTICRSGKKYWFYILEAVPWIMMAVTWAMYFLIKDNPKMMDGAFMDRFMDVELLVKDGVRMIAGWSWVDPYFSRTYPLDNFYVWMLATCGLIPCAAVLTAHTAMNAVCIRQKDEYLLTLSLVFAVYGLMENIPAYIAFDFLPCLVFAEVQSQGKPWRENLLPEQKDPGQVKV